MITPVHITSVMCTDSDGYSWETFWKVAGGIVLAAVAVAIVVATGGGALVALAAAGGGYLVGSNIATLIESGVYVANSDVKAMEQEQAENILAGDTTVGLCREDKLSLIYYLQESYPDRYADWTTSQMLREYEYHDRVFNSFTRMGIEPNKSGNWFERTAYSAKYVEFEDPQTPTTYFRLFVGNAWPFGG